MWPAAREAGETCWWSSEQEVTESALCILWDQCVVDTNTCVYSCQPPSILMGYVENVHACECVCVCTLRCWSCRRSSSSCLLLFSISVCFFLFSCYDIHALRLLENAQMHITKIRNRNNIIILKNNMNYIFIYAVLVWQLGNFGNFK